ncbi:MAG: type II toxin-antitoxin system VapC family toxin [Thermoplasmatota archaeon]
MILVDANVWAYYLDTNTAEHGRVKQALPRLLGEDDLLMPTVIQMEVIHYLVRRLGASASEAVDTFLAQACEVEPLTGGITSEAARLLLAHRTAGIGGRDAAILVIARRRDAHVLTSDKALGGVARTLGLQVTNPTER